MAMRRKQPKDASWPPTGVRDLKPDVLIGDKPDRVRFPTLRQAFEKATAVTPDTLTEQIVSNVLRSNRRYRDVEYLCRAYLQFGAEAMSPKDVQNLCAAINKVGR